MVVGLDSFREMFKGYEDCYTIIGGTACDILMTDAHLNFRATKDIDMILLIENRLEDFSKVFWEYIKSGKYRCGWKNADDIHFYRFTEPEEPGYPVTIELFSRNPGYQLQISDVSITPLHIADDISSLSAIVLNESYYQFMKQGRKVVNDIGVLSAEYLIPFKMRAWVDLTRRKVLGEHVNTKDLKKHKNDVFRLFQLVNPDEKVNTPKEIQEDIQKFLLAMPNEDIRLKNLGLDMKLDEVLENLQTLYLK